MRPIFFRPLLALAGLGLLSGCGTVESLMPHYDPATANLNAGASPGPRLQSAQLPTNPAEKPQVLPIASTDINCPGIDIAEGGAAVRVGGAESASVRYQFNISDTARQCDPAGPGEAAIKIGVAGNVVVGPAGSPGTFSAPLKITVTRDSDKKELYSRVYRVEASAGASSSGEFRVVSDPIVVPMPTLQLASIYSVTVGFQGGGGAPPRAHHRRRSGG